MAKVSPFARLILLLAAVKTAAGFFAFCFTAASTPRDYAFPYTLHLFFIVIFGAGATFLLLGGRDDPRAVLLGGLLLTVATTYCDKPLNELANLPAIAGSGALLALTINRWACFAFSPYFLWAFTREFPNPPVAVATRRAMDVGTTASALLGVFLFSANLARHLLTILAPEAGTPALLTLLVPKRGGGLYFGLLIPAIAVALAFMLWKGAHGVKNDQRRARIFLWSVGLGFVPILAGTLASQFIPGYRDYYMARPWLNRSLGFAVAIPALTVPFSCAYAVLVHQVLAVRLIARRAVQYLLARYTAVTLAAAPAAALSSYIYQHRKLTVEQLSGRSHIFLLFAMSAAGVATLYYRKGLLVWIDRRFFREQHDARQILTLLVERIRGAADGLALAKLIAREVDVALHLESIVFMIVDPRTGMLIDPRERGRRLDASSTLANLICGAADPLPTEVEDPRSPLARLPEKERHWLVDSGCRLVVPILARDGSLLGMIGLGEKKSGLPFLKEDRQLLRTIASSAAWVLELELGRSGVSGSAAGLSSSPQRPLPVELEFPAAQMAKECANCGALYQCYTVLCTHCSRRLEPAHVPYVLPGKFRFEKRIGLGGMGVVYRGTDLALGRPVAVKTMRRVSPEDAMRLRREARTAAAVAQPHLASIYGIETWQGTPMLILELLEGGTLAHRLEREKMPPRETVELGICIAGALAQLHAADILHRDIKPTNIGFTRDGIPKLTDFGIARIVFDLRRDPDLAVAEADLDHSSLLRQTSIWNQTPSSLTVSQQLAGTLAYLSPEALNGQRPDASFDLWSLAIVLYECLLGRKVFGAGDVRQIMTRIRLGRVPDFAQVCPEYDASLGDFFRCALHRTLARRPANALELKQRLEAALQRLVA